MQAVKGRPQWDAGCREEEEIREVQSEKCGRAGGEGESTKYEEGRREILTGYTGWGKKDARCMIQDAGKKKRNAK